MVGLGTLRIGPRDGQKPTDAGVRNRHAFPSPRTSAQIPMTLNETLAWGLGLLAFARLVLAPLGDHIARRHAARDTWSPT